MVVVTDLKSIYSMLNRGEGDVDDAQRLAEKYGGNPKSCVLLYAVARRTADQFPAPATARLAGFNVIGGPAKSVLAPCSSARRLKAATSVLRSWLIASRCPSNSLRTSAIPSRCGSDGAWP